MRLIDADALAKFIDYGHLNNPNEKLYSENDIREMIDMMPTQPVDAVPVKHGKWIDIDEQTYTWKVRCSCCGNERSMMSTQGKYPNYCEECGARMDGE